MTIGNQFGGPQFDSRGWPLLDSRFIIFVFSSSGGMKFVILVEDSDSAYCFGYNPGVRGEHPTIQLLWATARPLVTRVSLIYLRSRWVFLVTGVNQENYEAGGVQDSLVQLQCWKAWWKLHVIFDTHKSAVLRYFITWISLMHLSFGSIPIWQI